MEQLASKFALTEQGFLFLLKSRDNSYFHLPFLFWVVTQPRANLKERERQLIRAIYAVKVFYAHLLKDTAYILAELSDESSLTNAPTPVNNGAFKLVDVVQLIQLGKLGFPADKNPIHLA